MTNPFQDTFGQQTVQTFGEEFEDQKEPDQEPGFFQNFLDKFKPKPFKGNIEFITEEQLQKLEDPSVPLLEKRELFDDYQTQLEYEKGLAGTRGLTSNISRTVEPPTEFKLLDENARSVYETTGAMIQFAALVGPVVKGFELAAPGLFPFINRMAGAGTTAGIQELSREFFDPDQEVDPLKVAAVAGDMALLDGALQAAGVAVDFARNVKRIADVFDVSNSKAFKFVWDEAGKRGASIRGFAEDARQWADMAEELAQSAEKGTITLEVPDAKVGKKPIAEIEGPVIETEPISVEPPEIDPNSPVAQNIESFERQLARSEDILKSLENGELSISEDPVPSVDSIGLPVITSKTPILEGEGSQMPSGERTSTLEPPSGLPTNLATAPEAVRTGSTLTTLGIPHPEFPELIVRQSFNDVDAILDAANKYKPEFDKFLNELKENIPGISNAQSRVKQKNTILQKIEQKGPAETLGDYLGGRIVFDNLQDVEKIQKSLEDNFRVIEQDNFFKGRRDGYRAIHYQLDTGKGISIELQVMPKEMAEVFHENHVLYDKWKREDPNDLTPKQEAEREKDFAKMEKNFTDAWEKFKSRQKPIEIRKSKDQINKEIAFQKFRRHQLQKRLADLKFEESRSGDPVGISENLNDDIGDPDPTDLDPSDQKLLDNSEVNGDFQNGLLKPGQAEQLNQFWNKLGFNVERPFQQIGAPETGFRVKNFYSELARKEEQTIEVIRKIGNFDARTRAQLALLAERDTPPNDPVLREAYETIREFFDDTFKELQEAGVLKNPFPESYIMRLQEENLALADLAKEQPKKGKEILRQIHDNNALIKELRNTKFVSIPARLWFEEQFDLNRPVSQRVVKLLNQKKRKTPTIQNLIDEGHVKIEDVDIAQIMAYYGRRAARDIGLGKILKAAEQEGLASRSPSQGFVQLPAYQYPAIKDYYIHPQFADWLTSYTRPRQVGLFGRLSSKVKSFSFYNPVILPFNDLVQQLMATQGRAVKYWGEAIKDVLKKTPTFWEAHENGLFSQPYNMFEDDFRRQWTNALTENKTLPQRFKRFLLDDKIVNGLFRASSHVAWSADRMLRMATYRQFLSQVMTPRQAAQTAALFHGDYAMVNPNTRKLANQFFYTPTFKIVMGKLYSEMLKSPVKIGRAYMNGEAPDGVDKAKFWGLVGTIGTIIALDQYMTNGLGFEREQWGRKYSKKVQDDEGADQDLTVNFSNPANLPLKFFWRAVESFSPSNKTVFEEFLRKNKFELNPVINMVAKLVTNSDDNGDPIYLTYGDDSLTKLSKSSQFIASEIFPLIKQFADEPFEDPEARSKFFDEVGTLLNALPGSFVYWGPDEEQQKVRKIQQANREFVSELKRRAERGETIEDTLLENHRKLLEKLSEE